MPLKNFWYFCLKRPSRGWRTRIWPKTGTGSSFRRHFVGKTIFWVFLGPFSARCYGPRRSIFGSVSSLTKLNIWAKVQGRSSNVTYCPHWRLSAWRSTRNSVFCSKNLGSWTDQAGLWTTYGGPRHVQNSCNSIKNRFSAKFQNFFLSKWAKVQLPKFYPRRALGVPV